MNEPISVSIKPAAGHLAIPVPRVLVAGFALRHLPIGIGYVLSCCCDGGVILKPVESDSRRVLLWRWA